MSRSWSHSRSRGQGETRGMGGSRSCEVNRPGCTSRFGRAARHKRTSRHHVAEPVLARASLGAGAFNAPEGGRALCLDDRWLAGWVGRNLGQHQQQMVGKRMGVLAEKRCPRSHKDQLLTYIHFPWPPRHLSSSVAAYAQAHPSQAS